MENAYIFQNLTIYAFVSVMTMRFTFQSCCWLLIGNLIVDFRQVWSFLSSHNHSFACPVTGVMFHKGLIRTCLNVSCNGYCWIMRILLLHVIIVHWEEGNHVRSQSTSHVTTNSAHLNRNDLKMISANRSAGKGLDTQKLRHSIFPMRSPWYF